MLNLFARSRNSTGQVLEQLDLFVIALSRGLAQMIPGGLFQPKLFYDSLGFIFCLYSTCSLSSSDQSEMARAQGMRVPAELGLHTLTALLDGVFRTTH